MSTALLLSACSSSKNTGTETSSRNDVKGTWLLNTISYDGLPAGEKLKVSLLDEGDENCVTGSTWVFPNNGNGSYTIAGTGPDCTAGQRNIVWSYQSNGGQPILQYKRVESGVKPKSVTDGYRFRIISSTDTSLQLQSETSFEGKPVYINYNFSKQQE